MKHKKKIITNQTAKIDEDELDILYIMIYLTLTLPTDDARHSSMNKW